MQIILTSLKWSETQYFILRNSFGIEKSMIQGYLLIAEKQEMVQLILIHKNKKQSECLPFM